MTLVLSKLFHVFLILNIYYIDRFNIHYPFKGAEVDIKEIGRSIFFVALLCWNSSGSDIKGLQKGIFVIWGTSLKEISEKIRLNNSLDNSVDIYEEILWLCSSEIEIPTKKCSKIAHTKSFCLWITNFVEPHHLDRLLGKTKKFMHFWVKLWDENKLL